MNALVDALKEHGAEQMDMPVSGERVWTSGQLRTPNIT
jgi:hypothetical protein